VKRAANPSHARVGAWPEASPECRGAANRRRFRHSRAVFRPLANGPSPRPGE
jgi:hypothetical protein